MTQHTARVTHLAGLTESFSFDKTMSMPVCVCVIHSISTVGPFGFMWHIWRVLRLTLKSFQPHTTLYWLCFTSDLSFKITGFPSGEQYNNSKLAEKHLYSIKHCQWSDGTLIFVQVQMQPKEVNLRVWGFFFSPCLSVGEPVRVGQRVQALNILKMNAFFFNCDFWTRKRFLVKITSLFHKLFFILVNFLFYFFW